MKTITFLRCSMCLKLYLMATTVSSSAWAMTCFEPELVHLLMIYCGMLPSKTRGGSPSGRITRAPIVAIPFSKARSVKIRIGSPSCTHEICEAECVQWGGEGVRKLLQRSIFAQNRWSWKLGWQHSSQAAKTCLNKNQRRRQRDLELQLGLRSQESPSALLSVMQHDLAVQVCSSQWRSLLHGQ